MSNKPSMYKFACEFGVKAAKRLGELWNGQQLYITSNRCAIEFPNKTAKKKHFRYLNFYESMTTAEIGDMYGLTSKRVNEIINEDL